MNKLLLLIFISMGLSACQPKPEAPPQEHAAATETTNQRKEAARQLTVQAMTALGQKNFQAAVASLDAAIKLDPGNQDPYLILGQILFKAGEYERAAEFLDNAVKGFPDNGTMFYMLSIANRMIGKKLPAVLAARRSFELFKTANDQENAEKSAVLLQQVINSPDEQTESASAPSNP